jgi:hypothetical protein
MKRLNIIHCQSRHERITTSHTYMPSVRQMPCPLLTNVSESYPPYLKSRNDLVQYGQPENIVVLNLLGEQQSDPPRLRLMVRDLMWSMCAKASVSGFLLFLRHVLKWVCARKKQLDRPIVSKILIFTIRTQSAIDLPQRHP